MSSASSLSMRSISWAFACRVCSSRWIRSLMRAFAASCLAPSDFARLLEAPATEARTRSARAAISAASINFCSSMAWRLVSRSFRTAAEIPWRWSCMAFWPSFFFCKCSSRSRCCHSLHSRSSASRRASSASFASLRSSAFFRSSNISWVFFSVSRIFFFVFSSSAFNKRIRFASKMESCSARFRAEAAWHSWDLLSKWPASPMESPYHIDSLPDRGSMEAGQLPQNKLQAQGRQ
mmetsp:Transcript_39541/g.85430  ORF Transcript_39541/g.85430 Transcript_39541/m.85430 type:complete len:235 (+) Transcript_39541:280-984(+)